MKISTACERAINQHLCPTSFRWWEEGFSPTMEMYSCLALRRVLGEGFYSDLPVRVQMGLKNLGLDPEATNAFDSIPEGPKRQQARALWLTWVALMAKEQGQ